MRTLLRRAEGGNNKKDRSIDFLSLNIFFQEKEEVETSVGYIVHADYQNSVAHLKAVLLDIVRQGFLTSRRRLEVTRRIHREAMVWAQDFIFLLFCCESLARFEKKLETRNWFSFKL